MRAEALGDPVAFHGEGPFWDASRQRLLMMDMLAGAIVEIGPDGVPSRREFGGIAAVIRRRRAGGFVFAVERGIRMLDDDLALVGGVREVFTDPLLRMNEGGCDPAGRLFVGSMAYAATRGAGTLWRFEGDLDPRPVLTDVTISNGLQWTPDGSRAFYNDTGEPRVDVFEVDPGSGDFGVRRPFVDLAEAPGLPDGMAIDVDGGLWVALYGGSTVRRYDSEGVLSEVVELPCRNVTSCTFGGADLGTLFITTSRENVPEGEDPQAGAVFVAETGTRGAPQHAFAG